MSQLLMRLDARIREARDEVVLGELKVRKACYLARTGFAEDARRLIEDLRVDFGAGQNARISAWIMLAEGLVDYFECPGAVAKDRIARSELIAVATRDPELAALACAWKAQVEFEFSEFNAMARSLRKAFDFARPENNEANSRIAINISNCFFLCGDRAAGQKWFMISRDHALREGDQATIDALLYNKAAFSTASLRAKRCFEVLDRGQVELVRLEVASALNFQKLAGIIAVNHLVLLSEARILLLLEDFEGALKALRSIYKQGPFAAHNFDKSIIDLEISYCLFKMGQKSDGQAVLSASLPLDPERVDLDERLTYFWLRRELYAMGAENIDSVSASREFDRVAPEYLSYRDHLHALTADLANEWIEKSQTNIRHGD